MSVIERVRVLVLGDHGCGKTTLIRALCHAGRLKGDEPSTVGCKIHCRVEELPGRQQFILVEFWEVGGSPRFQYARDFFLSRSLFDGVILVHDVSWPSTRRGIRRAWLPELLSGSRSHPEYAAPSEFDVTKDQTNVSRPPLWQRGDSFLHALSKFIDLLIALARQLLVALLTDDLLDKADERRALRSCKTPVAIVGTKCDLASRDQKARSSDNMVAEATCVDVSVDFASTNSRLIGFIKQVIERRREKSARDQASNL